MTDDAILTEETAEAPNGTANGGSLSSRGMRGGAWVLGGYITSTVVRLFSNLAVAFFLSPSAFGIIGVALSLQAWLDMMTDLGVHSSVVREKAGESDAFINTAWTIQALRNFIIFVALMIVAGLGASPLVDTIFAEGTVYREPVMPAIVLATAFVVLANGFRSMGLAVYERRLDFRKTVLLQIGAQGVGSLLTIATAAAGFGVWSLVIGMVVSTMITVIGSFAYLRMPLPRYSLDPTHRATIINYGKWLLIASFLGFVVNRGDQLIFGGLLDADRFGLYAVAGTWILALRALFAVILNKLAYPVFSEIARERPDDRTRIYYRLRLFSDAGATSVFIAIWLLSAPAFDLIYPERYNGVADMIILMGLSVFLLPFNLLSTIVLSAGDSKRFTLVIIAPALTMFLAVPFIFKHAGFEPAVIVAASVNLFSVPVLWAIARHQVRINILREIPILIGWALAIFAILA